MLSLLILALVGAYMAVLFGVAWRAERRPETAPRRQGLGPWTYALSLAIYCTSWTYFGAVGTAARDGWEYLPIYLGPALGLTLMFPLWRRIAAAARRENTGSIADFLSSRYGKSQALGALVAGVAIAGSLPYIALQLKALAMGWALVSAGTPAAALEGPTVLAMAAVLAGFSILFGARRPDLTEHNRGLIHAIALESVVKLAALMAAALFAVILLTDRAPDGAAVWRALGPLAEAPPSAARMLAILLLATLAIFCLPRQFHVAFVEGAEPDQARRARVVFPIYLLLTSLAVPPLLAAGSVLGVGGDPDLLVLALPFGQEARVLTALVFVGGFSAATAMVIVETVALSAMASNSLILPLLARRRWLSARSRADMAKLILQVRRGVILGLMLLAWLYFQTMDRSAGLASIGLLSFAALAQLAPALFGAVLWKGGNARGAAAGIVTGVAIWTTLLAWPQITARPDAGDLLPLGVFLSLAFNTLAYVLVSRLSRTGLIDQIQAHAFVDRAAPEWSEAGPVPAGASVGELKLLVARFIGAAGAERAFAAWARESGREPTDADPADASLARAAERMLAGAVGSSSARRVIAAALAHDGRPPEAVLNMLDEASQAIQFNRELLQTTLENIDQGVVVVDRDLRLTAWNGRYASMFDLPAGFLYVGLPVAEIYRLNARRGESPTDSDAWVERRLDALRRRTRHEHEREGPDGRVLRSSGSPIPDGGYVTSYTDITEPRRAAQGLAEANEQLEARVADRTHRLAEAKQAAEAATASKTRFLAAASHDLLQPLHAARLFIGALNEDSEAAPHIRELARHADQAIESAHGLMTGLLNLSRLEAGGVRPAVAPMPLAPLLEALGREFEPQARAKGLRFRVVISRGWVTSDPDLLRSVLQNLAANAIRYTDRGGVLVGCRRQGANWRITVTDTGRGIPSDAFEAIFSEFVRLPGAAAEPGVGLGLAIVRRVADLLGHRTDVRSREGRGSAFSILAPRAEATGVLAAPQPPQPPSPVRGLRVLCVDNEPAIREGVAALLERWDAVATTAPGAAAALALTGPFDAVLADLHLGPGPDGLEVLDAFRARGVARLALITADSGDAPRARAQALNAAVLGKPLKPAALRAFLSRRS